MSAPHVDLILHRLALLEFRPAPGQEASIGANYADVIVEALASKEGAGTVKVLVDAAVPLEYRPKLTRDHRVVVPDDRRRRCELAIEAIADLVSIAERCSRSIASPFPWVAFEATCPVTSEWLADAVGIHELDLIVEMPSASSRVDLTPEIIDGLRDRSDGTVLLAEALAHGHPTAQFQDLFRVFERAFTLLPGLLSAPLHDFLHERYGYTEQEIENWKELRDAAAHADVRQRFVVEADVRPVLARVKQAAYDVLFNKECWRNRTSVRRELWSPNGWTSQPSDLDGAVSALPAGWWAPLVTPKTPERAFEVVPASRRTRVDR